MLHSGKQKHTLAKNGMSSTIYQPGSRKLSCYSDIKLNSHLRFAKHTENDFIYLRYAINTSNGNCFVFLVQFQGGISKVGVNMFDVSGPP